MTGSPSSVTHVYADGDADYTISATAADEDGTWNSNSLAVHVRNVAPTLTVSGPSAVDEGSVYTLGLASTDPGADTISKWVVTWGDGTTSTGTGNPSSVTHTYADGPADYTISATASDEDGTWSSNSLGVHIRNVAPTVTAAADQEAGVNAPVTMTAATFTDPGFTFAPAGTSETFAATINWGDGSSAQLVIPAVTQGSAGVLTAGSVVGTHTYAVPGEYTVAVTVADDDGGSATRTFTI